MALYDSENNRLLDTNDNVLEARVAGLLGDKTIQKQYIGSQEVKAIYIGSNLVYEKPIVLPQLSAPVISLDNDTLTIEEVENAEYYDIYVDGVLEESVPVANIISFTINDTPYQAESGMTWGEWVNSAYNTDGFVTDGDYVYTIGYTINVMYSHSNVLASDTIIPNGDYTTGGSGNN